MSKSDIVVTLFTIIYGLMLTDLFSSFHRLISEKTKVKWHWLPLLASWYLFLTVLKNWWSLVFVNDNLNWLNIIFFIAYGHLLLLIFLAVSITLPDKVGKNEMDLKTYYFQNHTYFWGLMTTIIFTTLLISVLKGINTGTALNLPQILGSCLFMIITALLAISKKMLVHSTLLVFIVLVNIFEITMKALPTAN